MLSFDGIEPTEKLMINWDSSLATIDLDMTFTPFATGTSSVKLTLQENEGTTVEKEYTVTFI